MTDPLQRTRVTVGIVRGWDVVRLRSSLLDVYVLPGKGGDILSICRRSDGLELLWRTPWGLRERGAHSVAESSVERLMQGYAGGWQTVFPNGGDEVVAYGANWGMHGEVWLAPFDFETRRQSVAMSTSLLLSPFGIRKRISLTEGTIRVKEWISHTGSSSTQAMWSHHPAFSGTAVFSPVTRLSTNAARVEVDDVRDTPSSDLERGSRGAWPIVQGRNSLAVSLARIPDDLRVDRMAYLMDFPDDAQVTIDNPERDLRVELTWSSRDFPYAWYWLERGGTEAFPWFGRAEVLAIEPASNYPARGLVAAQAKSRLLEFTPGETRKAELRVSVGRSTRR